VIKGAKQHGDLQQWESPLLCETVPDWQRNAFIRHSTEFTVYSL